MKSLCFMTLVLLFGIDKKGLGESIFSKSVSFELIDNGFKTDCNDSDTANSTSSRSSDSNWDKVLKEHENYVDSYII
ncbi:MAG: hypothetical protein BGO34_03805 [Bacteroidia bacterium 44-10]|nr:MAG: hypothetical protein BGO34_03805 [Bacteroidia bacterium 44-10]